MELQKKYTIAELNALSKNTLMETLGIEFTEMGKDFIKGKMFVDSKVYQVEGLLHGGATAALAETMGSLASYVFAKDISVNYRGIGLSSSHVRGVQSGYVYATAKPLHIGKTTQVWEIRIEDEQDRLINISKLTTISVYK